ncbi:hypothetical protein E4188_16445 [Aeromonas media]|uniref:Uncharacterized protein n=1 Tax=Aeromonas media TaxID=651 RepID=A0ABX6NU78_AERME|nr:hypothetical protein [Aeromonas media]QJT34350.1 hypothetical protein E4187_08290 [Aeromonas media]QJT39928.1 hypothetical protein E4188_16445 [Aeromonas media]
MSAIGKFIPKSGAECRFKSNAGIQKAYNQAHALEKNLIANGQVELYDRKGKKLTVLDYAKLKKIYCICVTRDDFGAMATDLSLLLEKDEDFAYPWAVNITDLEFMIDGLLHLDMNHEKFYQYLEQRRLIHGKVFGLDELEYAGAFLKYNGLDKFIQQKPISYLLTYQNQIYLMIFISQN